MSRTDRDFASAHVKSLYETSIVGRIMNRYVQCSSHLFSYPATGAVTCVHTQLRATVTRTMPSIDPSSMESKRSAKSCTCAGAADISRWSCIVYSPPPSPPPCGLLVRRSVKVLVKLSRARFMREVHGDKDIQRSGRAWAADTWRLVSVAWRMTADAPSCVGDAAGLHPPHFS